MNVSWGKKRRMKEEVGEGGHDGDNRALSYLQVDLMHVFPTLHLVASCW